MNIGSSFINKNQRNCHTKAFLSGCFEFPSYSAGHLYQALDTVCPVCVVTGLAILLPTSKLQQLSEREWNGRTGLLDHTTQVLIVEKPIDHVNPQFKMGLSFHAILIIWKEAIRQFLLSYCRGNLGVLYSGQIALSNSSDWKMNGLRYICFIYLLTLGEMGLNFQLDKNPRKFSQIKPGQRKGLCLLFEMYKAA